MSHMRTVILIEAHLVIKSAAIKLMEKYLLPEKRRRNNKNCNNVVKLNSQL